MGLTDWRPGVTPPERRAERRTDYGVNTPARRAPCRSPSIARGTRGQP